MTFENDAKNIHTEDLAINVDPGTKNVPTGTLMEMERDMISTSLSKTGTNMAESARQLGISRATLYRKVKQYQLEQK